MALFLFLLPKSAPSALQAASELRFPASNKIKTKLLTLQPDVRHSKGFIQTAHILHSANIMEASSLHEVAEVLAPSQPWTTA